MFIQILLAVIAGICAGVISGLIPGLHVNTISLLAVSLSPFLLRYFPLLSLCCFIVSMAVAQTFLNSIPAVYLGAPDSEKCLGVLPGHRYLLKGKGYTAVKLTVIGSLFGLILSLLILPLAVMVVKYIYPLITWLIGYLILAVVIFMIWRDKKPFWSLAVFSASGFLGLIVLNIPNIKNPLFPLLSGLFGISTLLFSINSNTEIPAQKINSKLIVRKWVLIKSVIFSTIAGFLTSMLPGLGASQGAVIAKQLAGKTGDNGFMILLGGINTVNFSLSLATLYVLGKARNGAVASMQQIIEKITINHLMAFSAAALVSGAVALFLALFFGRVFSRIVEKVNYKFLVLGVAVFIFVLTLPLSGFYGALILFTSTFLGFIPAIVKCSRTHAMGCLLVPVMVFFLFS